MEYGVGVRRRRRRRGELVSKQLVLDTNILYIDTPVGSKIGTVINKISSSTLSLTDSDSGRFSLVDNIIYVGSTLATPDVSGVRKITLLEVQPNGVKQYSQVLMTILDSEFASKMDFRDSINSGLVVLL